MLDDSSRLFIKPNFVKSSAVARGYVNSCCI